MAAMYRQKKVAETGLPLWEMEAQEYTGDLAAIQAWCPFVTEKDGKVMLYGMELVPGQWIVKNTVSNQFSPATTTFLQYHDPI